MIYPKRYNHVLYDKLEAKTVGNFSINKLTEPKGFLIRTYHPAGYFYHDRLSKELPVVTLVENNHTLMSDSPMEQESYRYPISFARGNVLIIGLGVGLFLELLKERNKTVDHITVVELNREVKYLVWDKVKTSKSEIVIGEGKEYLKAAGKWYDYIFIDVWGSINATLLDIRNWQELAQGCLKEKGTVNYWLEALYDRVKRRLSQGAAEATSAPGMHDPCLVCGKKMRNDYAGLCGDCADTFDLSELFTRQ